LSKKVAADPWNKELKISSRSSSITKYINKKILIPSFLESKIISY